MKDHRQCNACQGRYFAIQADGMRYFHACPPAAIAEDGLLIPFSGARNENIALDDQGHSQGVIFEGAGFTRRD